MSFSGVVRIVPYEPVAHFPLLEQLATERPGLASLGHRPFVDWYFTSEGRCRLFLALKDDQIAGLVGVERLQFAVRGSQLLQVGFGHNFHSFVPGVGALLFLQWIKSYGGGVAFGGTPDTYRIIRSQRWTLLEDIYEWTLNPPREGEHGEPLWKSLARSARSRLLRVDLRGLTAVADATRSARCMIRPLHEYADGVLPEQTEFSWRFHPSVAHLSWRYPLKDGPVRYRAYKAERAGESLGTVVLSWRPDQVIPAHIDVVRRSEYMPVLLSALSVFAEENPDAKYASVRLAAQESELEDQLRRARFRKARQQRLFALGKMGGPLQIDIPRSGGNFSLGIGDIDLRQPFW